MTGGRDPGLAGRADRDPIGLTGNRLVFTLRGGWSAADAYIAGAIAHSNGMLPTVSALNETHLSGPS
jgi:hypothetical protein